MFATQYLQRNNNSGLIEYLPHPGTGMIIVVPCFQEPDILKTLRSLSFCDTPLCRAEVIVLINHPQNASSIVKNINKNTEVDISEWILKNNRRGLIFFAAGPVELPGKWAGAGLARKSGMDEAVRRFNILNKPDGIIVSLDADTLVDKNYLQSIKSYFKKNPKEVGATISFKHQIHDLSAKHLQGIRLYEKYMVYYKNALRFTGYPYPMFTIGSAFTVKAKAYVRRGGMNRRQAGEDFYFLQQLVQLGPVGEINSTTVYPSARLSDRVPFGTGPILRRWLNDKEDLTKTYNFQAFKDLKEFFDKKDLLFKASREKYYRLITGMPQSVTRFLEADDFWLKISDINKNCSSLSAFHKRFFQKFNAFKILKFLNFVHKNVYEKADLNEQISKLNLLYFIVIFLTFLAT